MRKEIPTSGVNDGYLQEYIDELIKKQQNYFDAVIFIFGREGTAKSTLAFQIAKSFDKDFSIKKICFDAKSFLKLVSEGKRGDCIVLDEAFATFASASRMNKLNVAILSNLTRIRSKGLFLIIISPVFFEMNKMLVVHRSNIAIRTEAKGDERGFFYLYDYKAKAKLYRIGKREYDLYCVKPTKFGRFSHWCPIDWNAYERFKDKEVARIDAEVFGTIGELDDATKQVIQDKQFELIASLRDAGLLKAGSNKFLWEKFRISETTLIRLVNEGRDRAKQEENTENLSISPENPSISPLLTIDNTVEGNNETANN